MASKPSILAKWQEGETPYTIKFLCATMNWLISFADELKGETEQEVSTNKDNQLYIEVAEANLGTPVLKIKGTAGQKLISGDDSNVVISSEQDAQGFYTIDVYYK